MKKTITLLLLFISTLGFAQCFQNISAGNKNSSALKADGSIWTWGQNNSSQIGDATTVNHTTPFQVGNTGEWQSVTSAMFSTFALKTDGTLWAWGSNTGGQMGNGTAGLPQPLVTQIGTDTDWQSVVANDVYAHVIAIKTDGTLWNWGYNGQGTLGDGTIVDHLVPAQMGTDNDWASVATGYYHVVALKTNGTLWTWGRNNYGQLGDGTTTNSLVPIQIGTDTDWQFVATGTKHSLAIKTDGTLWVWGHGLLGKLGLGNSDNALVPTQVGTDTDWQSARGGESHSVAIKTNGTLWGWGWNYDGELGNGLNTFTDVPLQSGTDIDWQNAIAGNGHSIAIKTDGSVYTYGQNDYGQLGDGTTTIRLVPTPIGCPTSAPLAVEHFTDNEMKIFPNPVKDVLNISFDKEITAAAIYNILGQQVISKSLNANEGTIDMSNLHTGTYFIKVQSGKAVKTLKVIKS